MNAPAGIVEKAGEATEGTEISAHACLQSTPPFDNRIFNAVFEAGDLPYTDEPSGFFLSNFLPAGIPADSANITNIAELGPKFFFFLQQCVLGSLVLNGLRHGPVRWHFFLEDRLLVERLGERLLVERFPDLTFFHAAFSEIPSLALNFMTLR